MRKLLIDLIDRFPTLPWLEINSIPISESAGKRVFRLRPHPLSYDHKSDGPSVIVKEFSTIGLSDNALVSFCKELLAYDTLRKTSPSHALQVYGTATSCCSSRWRLILKDAGAPFVFDSLPKKELFVRWLADLHHLFAMSPTWNSTCSALSRIPTATKYRDLDNLIHSIATIRSYTQTNGHTDKFPFLFSKQWQTQVVSIFENGDSSRKIRTKNYSILHGDLKPENIFLMAGGFTCVDWELMSIGPIWKDLAYFAYKTNCSSEDIAILTAAYTEHSKDPHCKFEDILEAVHADLLIQISSRQLFNLRNLAMNDKNEIFFSELLRLQTFFNILLSSGWEQHRKN